MNKYINFFYYQFIKKNVLMLKKLGKNVDDRKFIFFILVVTVLSIIVSLYLNMTLKSTVILVALYVGAALSLPSMMYEQKIETLENNIPQALYIMILSLESGRSLNEALEEVVKSNIKEVSDIFRKVIYLIEHQKISFEEAITVVSTLYGSRVLMMLARIMIENRKYGGDLSDSLRILAKTLEDFKSYKRQLLSVTASGLAVGFIILCGVIPAVAGLLGAYLLTISNMLDGITPIPPVKPEDILQGLETVQMGTAIIGALFSIPIFGLKVKRMFLTSAITMTIGILAYYTILKIAPGFFT
ncbi:type II secretion system F family protein [Methanocaldococcus fervens]|uniref:Type II secretion system F domain protein n=1 Tax=Methanocaldococcus fervens (strain DSM 4213 / JCM 15782 / AG86) TaxID=573064 RepID=C7P8G2_METFA|nr:type II secretion system F family protein [Methanocaldococcus fervens]ACV24844.1 Type II secretion system F domain protein [Methanocaldococcus fervens AG86]